MATTTGFVTGLGGGLTLPITLSANLVGVLATQLRMITGIACLGGYDVHDNQVRTMCYVCLCGNSAGKILKNVGVQASNKTAQSTLKRLPFSVIKRINQTVGHRLVTKFGATGLINLGKVIPVAGGVVGAGFDGVTTKIIGSVAHKTFIS